jgi:uncharacterized RDD family membrane protein YckC
MSPVSEVGGRAGLSAVAVAEPGAPARATPASSTAVSRPAGFWRRALALVLDLVVVTILLAVGDRLAGALAARQLVARAFQATFDVVVPTAYFVLMHGAGGQTLGKMLVGARVVGTSGEPIGYLRALGREAAAVLSALLLFLGYAMAAVRRDKRALHDLLAGSRVVRARRGAR